MAKMFEYDNIPPVKTKQGLLKGYRYDGTYIFKGIRYAKAARFQKPQEPDSWEGVREAASYGFVSPMLTQDNPQGELAAPHRYWPCSEHCQNLNIWTPSLEGKRPVLVWLHGGGFFAGSSIEQKAYNGENMAKYGDVVVVTVNHRLNILGYLDLSPYGEKYANSANAGQDDLIAALRWVQENIAAFGGDPDNVTIFGQSGGGMKVSGLMQMPEADGLFHKGIIMSGVAGDLMPYSTGDSRPIIQALLKELGLNEDQVEQLETIPYRTLADAYNKLNIPMAMQGHYTGCNPKPNRFYKGEGPQYGFTEHAKTIPLLVGTAIGEFAMMPLPFNKNTVPAEVLDGAIRQRFGEHADALIRQFREAYPGRNLADLLVLDTTFRPATKAFIHSFAQAGGTAYAYLFGLDFPYQNGKAAWHCSDIPFVFHNAEMVPVCNIPDVSDKLEEQIFGAVISFAKTGCPQHSGIPQWPASTAEDEATMIFDRECVCRHNHDNQLQESLAAALPKLNMLALLAAMMKPDDDAPAGSQIQH